jgi:hypothetical protein
MWVIVDAFTLSLNRVVMACVMKKCHGHWLLFNVLTIAMILTINL